MNIDRRILHWLGGWMHEVLHVHETESMNEGTQNRFFIAKMEGVFVAGRIPNRYVFIELAGFFPDLRHISYIQTIHIG